MDSKIHKIVLTGGPCGGKSTGIAKIEQSLSEKGYKVYIVDETATQLITSRIVPGDVDLPNFQSALLQMQRQKEIICERVADALQGAKGSVVVYDRGCLDAKAFMGDEMFKELLEREGYRENELRDHYDGVFHLVSAAKGAKEYYTLENNEARTETIEEAASIDDALISAWTGHPHLRVIDNSTGFEGKIQRLLCEICSLLGEPEPLEIERKFVVDMPDLDWLLKEKSASKVEILQTYLKAKEGATEARVRQRGVEGDYSYYYTEKKELTGAKRVERERRITKEEYLQLLMDVDTEIGQVRKTRYCFVDGGVYYELDVYPFLIDRAIMEVELAEDTENIVLPGFIKSLGDVTGDARYKNRNIARNRGI